MSLIFFFNSLLLKKKKKQFDSFQPTKSQPQSLSIISPNPLLSLQLCPYGYECSASLKVEKNKYITKREKFEGIDGVGAIVGFDNSYY